MSESINEKLWLEYVGGIESPAAQTFLRLARPYMAEIRTEADEGIDEEKFLQSILHRQGEPDRWLALFILGKQVAGFAHFNVDKVERPGTGHILEFYVIPARRRQGLGKLCTLRILSIFAGAGCPTAWLASHPAAESFWRACGFHETGELERDQKVLAKTSIARRKGPRT